MWDVSRRSCSFAHPDQSLVREVRLNQTRPINKIRNTNLFQIDWRHNKSLRPRKHLRGVSRVYLSQNLVIGFAVTLCFHFFYKWRAAVYFLYLIIISLHEKCVVCVRPERISRFDPCLIASRVFVPVVSCHISLLGLASTKMTVLTSGCRVSAASMSFLGLGWSYFVRLALLRLDFETQNRAKTRRHNFSLLQLGLLKSFV